MNNEITEVNSNLGFPALVIGQKEFDALYDLPISDFVEVKGHGTFKASYLSWAHARKMLHHYHPNLFIAFVMNKETNSIVHPMPLGYALYPYLTNGSEGTPPTFFPIMDHSFNAIAEPDACDINKSIQRAKVKCIAEETGLGLRLYAGEDIPEGDMKKVISKTITPEAEAIIDDADSAYDPLEEKEAKEPVSKYVKDDKGDVKAKLQTEEPDPDPAMNEIAEAVDELSEEWKTAVIPFGKNKGKKLEDLTNRQIHWYWENYEVNEQFPDSIALRKHLDEWHQSVQDKKQAEADKKQAEADYQKQVDDGDLPF